MSFLEFLEMDPAPARDGSPDAPSQTPPRFACRQCHRVVYFSPVQRGSWNRFITYISAGLLYGHEVPKPAWFKHERQQPYRPLPGAKPSVRQEQVLDGIKRGLTMKQIAQELGIRKDTVGKYAQIVYRHHHVRTRKELMETLQRTAPRSVTRRARRSGESRGASTAAIESQINRVPLHDNGEDSKKERNRC